MLIYASTGLSFCSEDFCLKFSFGCPFWNSFTCHSYFLWIKKKCVLKLTSPPLEFIRLAPCSNNRRCEYRIPIMPSFGSCLAHATLMTEDLIYRPVFTPPRWSWRKSKKAGYSLSVIDGFHVHTKALTRSQSRDARVAVSHAGWSWSGICSFCVQ